MTRLTLTDDTGTEIVYRIVRKPNKHIYLAIKNGIVEVRAHPRVSETQIAQLIHQKSAWIREKQRANKPLSSQHNKTSHILLWGETLPWVCNDTIQHATVSQGRFTIPSGADLDDVLINTYRTELTQHLAQKVPIFAERMQLFPEKVSVRHTKSRWGSCSSKNHLSFSLLAAQLPVSVVNYLIVHELAHIRHKHHQASFWALVAQHCSNVTVERQRLREFEQRVRYLK